MSGPIRRLPRWLDRAGFEADKMMRANRVRSEASRLREQSDDLTFGLGKKVLELVAAGEQVNAELLTIAEEIGNLQGAATQKDEEVKSINSEQWVEPEVPTQVRPAAAARSAPAAPADPIAKRLQSYVDAKNNDFNCPKCGTVIRPNAAFCPKCGRKVIR